MIGARRGIGAARASRIFAGSQRGREPIEPEPT